MTRKLAPGQVVSIRIDQRFGRFLGLWITTMARGQTSDSLSLSETSPVDKCGKPGLSLSYKSFAGDGGMKPSRRSFLGLVAALPLAPALAGAMFGIDGGGSSGQAAWAIATDARKEAERARWRRVGILRPDGTFNPERFIADARTRLFPAGAESRPGSQGSPSGCSANPPTVQLCQMISLSIPRERQRGES